MMTDYEKSYVPREPSDPLYGMQIYRMFRLAGIDRQRARMLTISKLSGA